MAHLKKDRGVRWNGCSMESTVAWYLEVEGSELALAATGFLETGDQFHDLVSNSSVVLVKLPTFPNLSFTFICVITINMFIIIITLVTLRPETINPSSPVIGDH